MTATKSKEEVIQLNSIEEAKVGDIVWLPDWRVIGIISELDSASPDRLCLQFPNEMFWHHDSQLFISSSVIEFQILDTPQKVFDKMSLLIKDYKAKVTLRIKASQPNIGDNRINKYHD